MSNKETITTCFHISARGAGEHRRHRKTALSFMTMKMVKVLFFDLNCSIRDSMLFEVHCKPGKGVLQEEVHSMKTFTEKC